MATLEDFFREHIDSSRTDLPEQLVLIISGIIAKQMSIPPKILKELKITKHEQIKNYLDSPKFWKLVIKAYNKNPTDLHAQSYIYDALRMIKCAK